MSDQPYRGECRIDLSAMSIKTKAGQPIRAAVQAHILECLRNHGLPIAPGTGEGIVIYSEGELWRRIELAAKAIGCTTVHADCQPHEHAVTFKWR